MTPLNILNTYGDIGQVALPLASGVYALYKKDYRGAAWLILTVLVNQVFIDSFKVIIPETRPNGLDKSFPSGHTAAAFLGPAFLVMRYGLSTMPIPIALSTIAAIGIGMSRVLVKAHWMHDVIAGVVLGCSVAFVVPRLPLTTSPKSRN